MHNDDTSTPAATTTAQCHPAKKHSVWGIILKYVVPLVITVGLCWLLMNGMDLNEMWRIIRTEIDFRWMVANISLLIVAYIVRAARWKMQLAALGVYPSFWELCLSIFGTYSVNVVFPRLGEVWRTGFIANREDAPFSTVFGSMVFDRLMDTVVVGAVTIFTFIIAGSQLHAYLSQDPERMQSLMAIAKSPILRALVAVGIALVAWVVFSKGGNKYVRMIRDFCVGLWQGFAVFAKMPRKALWIFYTLLIWGCFFAALWCAFRSYQPTRDLLSVYGGSAMLICFVMTSISMAVPSNGGIGPYQWAMIFALSFYRDGVPELNYQNSATFANMVMGVETLMLIVLGIFTFVCIALLKKPTAKSRV